MAITNFTFKCTNRTWLTKPWTNNFIYGAMLVASSYSYSADHSTYADFKLHTFADYEQIDSKRITFSDNNRYTVFRADSLQFSGQNSNPALGIVIFSMTNGAPEDSDQLLTYYQFPDPQVLVNPIEFDPDFGVYAIEFSGYFDNVLLAESFENETAGEKWRGLDFTEIVEVTGNNGKKTNVLRCEYVPASNGSARIYAPLNLSKTTKHAILTYWVKFEEGFEFVLGGKMPGLQPLDEVSGGLIVNPDEWSARVMWRQDGKVQGYYYSQDMISPYGEGLYSEESDVFKPGRWQFVEVEVKINSTPTSDDGYLIVSVDGEARSSNPAIRFNAVDEASADIFSMVFSTFFGGGTPEWAPTKTVYAQFDDFRVYDLSGVNDDS